PESPNATTPFNALYNKEGKFVKMIAFETDAKIKAAAESGDSNFQPSGPGYGNSAVSLGAAITGADGYIYALRFTSPPTTYVVSPAGEVQHKFTIGDASQIALGLHV